MTAAIPARVGSVESKGPRNSSLVAGLALLAPAVTCWIGFGMVLVTYQLKWAFPSWLDPVLTISFYTAFPTFWLGMILLVEGRLSLGGTLLGLALASISFWLAQVFLGYCASV